MSITSMMVRAMFKEGDDKRDAGLTTPEDIVRFDDILYGADPKWQALDVYRPKAAGDRPLPVIVSVHGGGWVYGDKERYQYYCMSLAQRGFAVVNFTYRLAPEFKFPSSLEDTNLAFSWVLSHGAEYGFDTNHIFGVGDSAGAQILALFSCICTNPAYAAKYPFCAPQGFVPTALALNCGVYRIEPKGNDMTAMLMKELLPHKGTPEEIELLNVLDYITGDFPPTLYMTCSDDFLKDQAPLLGARLEQEGVRYESRFYGDEKHKLGHVFHCNMKSEDAKQCNDDECAFFRTFV